MRKILSAILLGTLITLFAGCSSSGGSGDGSSTPAATVPDAPIIGVATAGNNGQATVAFTAPSSNGGATITKYTVTSNPGSITATGTSSPITITGLTNGTSYIFTVTATNSVGTSAASAVSNAVVPYTLFSVSGTIRGVVSDGTYLYVAVAKTGTRRDMYLDKFDLGTNLIWEEPVLVTSDYDDCINPTLYGGKVSLFCVQSSESDMMISLSPVPSGVVFIEQMDTATGQSKTETQISGSGTPEGMFTDQATGNMYIVYLDGSLGYLVRIDQSINNLGYVQQPFDGKVAISSDAIYASINDGRDMIVKKYTKDLSTLSWTYTHSPSSSSYVEWLVDLVVSNDGGTLFISGPHDVLSTSPSDLLITVNTSTGNGTDNNIGGLLNDMAFDATGNLYGQLSTAVKVNVSNMTVTTLNTMSGDLYCMPCKTYNLSVKVRPWEFGSSPM
jgi:Fibronectin type III domain